MKRYWLALALALVVVFGLILGACGMMAGSYEFSSTYEGNKYVSASGGNEAIWTDFIDINVTNNTTNVTVNSGVWSITKNIGGAGSVQLASAAVGASCTTATVLETLAFTAGTVSTVDTPLSVTTVAALTGFIRASAGSGYRLCFTYTQSDLANPINIEVKFRLNVTAVGNKL